VPRNGGCGATSTGPGSSSIARRGLIVLNWLIFGIPWWVHAASIIIVVGCLIFLAAMTFGWPAVIRVLRPIALPIVGVLAALALLDRSRQSGYEAREDVEDQAAKKAETIVDNERREAQALPDDKLDREVDRWSKH
jgi:hypothetical protein